MFWNCSDALSLTMRCWAAMLGPLLLRVILITNFCAILATMPQFFAVLFVYLFGKVDNNECYVEAAISYLGWKVTSATMATILC